MANNKPKPKQKQKYILLGGRNILVQTKIEGAAAPPEVDMTLEETSKAWDLACQLFPPPRNIDVRKKQTAWYLTFREYSYAEVRDAITKLPHTGQKFFPDAQEISELLPERHQERISAVEYEMAVRQYCRLVGAEQPPYNYTPRQLMEWFVRVRDEQVS